MLKNFRYRIVSTLRTNSLAMIDDPCASYKLKVLQSSVTRKKSPNVHKVAQK